MTSEKSQIKFAKSERTGELIGFVSRHSKTRQLKGVREDSRYGKQICVLAEDLKGTIERPIKPLDSYLVDRRFHSLPIPCPLANVSHLSCGDILSFDATQVVILFQCQLVQIIHLQ